MDILEAGVGGHFNHVAPAAVTHESHHAPARVRRHLPGIHVAGHLAGCQRRVAGIADHVADKNLAVVLQHGLAGGGRPGFRVGNGAGIFHQIDHEELSPVILFQKGADDAQVVHRARAMRAAALQEEVDFARRDLAAAVAVPGAEGAVQRGGGQPDIPVDQCCGPCQGRSIHYGT